MSEIPVHSSVPQFEHCKSCQLPKLDRECRSSDESLGATNVDSRSSDQQPPLTYSKSVGDAEWDTSGASRAEQIAASNRYPGLPIRNMDPLLRSLSRMSKDITVLKLFLKQNRVCFCPKYMRATKTRHMTDRRLTYATVEHQVETRITHGDTVLYIVSTGIEPYGSGLSPPL
jgi:hypothetical protein